MKNGNGTFVSCHPAIVWITYMEEQKDGIDRVIEEPETERIEGGGVIQFL